MTSTRRIRRVRRSAAGVLGVIGCAFVAIAVIGMWAKNDVLDNSRYVSEVSPIVSEPAVQTDLAHAISARVEQSLDIEAVLRKTLPDSIKGSAPALADMADQMISKGIERAIRWPTFATTWSTANRIAHTQLVAILRGNDSAAVSSSSGTEVTLSLRPFLDHVLEGVSTESALDLPSLIDTSKVDLDFVLVRSDKIGTAQTAIRWIDRLGPAAWIIAAFCLIGAILLSRKRIGAAAYCSWGITLANAALLAAAHAGWSSLEGNVDDSGLGVATAKSFASALATPLVDRIRLLLIVSAVVAVVLTVVSRLASRRRHSVLDDLPRPEPVARNTSSATTPLTAASLPSGPPTMERGIDGHGGNQ